jgi:bacteriocin-type transport-associated protein
VGLARAAERDKIGLPKRHRALSSIADMRKSLLFLGILSDADIDWMSTQGTREKVPGGRVLIHEGGAIEAVYVVVDGALSVSAAATGGREIARLLSGEIVGEMSFVDSRPPSATVTAVEDSVVLTLPRPLLQARLEQIDFAARFYRAIAVFLASRLRSTVGRLGYGGADVRDDGRDASDEMDPDVLANVGIAAARFDWMLRRLRGQ